MTLSAAFLAAWKSLRPWREDPRLARARHADMFARGEREKLLLWREGWHCPTAGMLNRGAGGMSRWADANPNTSCRVAKRASTLLTSAVTASRRVAWLGGGFPPPIVASDWMKASTPPPLFWRVASLRIRPSVMETASTPLSRLSVTHKSTSRTCPHTQWNHPWLTNNLLSPCLWQTHTFLHSR